MCGAPPHGRRRWPPTSWRRAPTATVATGSDTASVAYGTGNFHFYAKGGPSAQTGVLTVRVGKDGVVGVVGDAWHPATIRSGRPELLSAEALEGSTRSTDELVELGQQCGCRQVAPSNR